MTVHIPPRPVRRILLPAIFGVLLVLAVGFTVATVVGAIVAPLGKNRRLLRVASFATAYCGVEMAVVVASLALWLRRPRLGRWRVGTEAEWVAAHQALLTAALGWILDAARRCFGFRVVLADVPEPGALLGPEAVLVLARHGGPGDSFALVHLLLTRYHRRVRVVLKDILQIDPVLDLLLNRLDCCFLTSGRGEDLSGRLATVAADMGPTEALLVFPEGGNWTPRRRHRAIHRLRSHDKAEAARAAALMTNVLPPRPAGVLACLEARPGLSVVVVAHAGLDRIFGLRQAWEQLPLTRPMTVRAWPAVATPDGEEARVAWLTTEWATVDEWVDAHHAGFPGDR